MKQLKIVLIAFGIVFSNACKENKEEQAVEDSVQEVESVEEKTTKITIAPLTDSPAYLDAKLMLDTPETMILPEAGESQFSFDLENYTLGEQTQSVNADKLANSGKGQHIHFILNNQPYMAHYETNFKKEIPEGVHHLVAFLSRSYHESVKNENSVVVRKLVVGENPEDSLGVDMDAPTLIYSRPKGEYSGKGAENILLDFFVLNTELSETGHKVIATINGESFTIDKWAPYIINGLPMGEVTIGLKLIDAEGNVVPGPFNTVERKVMLKE